LEPAQKQAEVVAGSGEHGVDAVAIAAGEIVAAYAVILLEVADDGFDGGATSTKPASFRPWRNAVTRSGTSVNVPLRRDPTTGIAGCCAHAPLRLNNPGLVNCSPYGMACTHCNDLLIAAKSSAHVSKHEVRH